jgi:hypothetical protein
VSLGSLLSGDTVTVESYVGETAYGPGYGPPIQVDCRVEPSRQLVRTTEGDEVVSEATIYVLPAVDGVDTLDLFAIESRVTHRGRVARVISANPRRGMGGPVYVEVVLT